MENIFNKMKAGLANSFSALKRLRTLVLFFAATHTVFLIFGMWMSYQDYPGVVELRGELLKEIQELPYLQPLVGPLAGNLPLKVLYTLFFNFIFGAFVSTTLTGVVFFIPYLIAVWRSFLIGILFYAIEDKTPLMDVVFYGTFILEFGAYCFSSAAGTNLGLSIIWPQRKGVLSRKEAFERATLEAKRLYIFVFILLFLGAIWEITWLHYLGSAASPAVTG